MSQTSYRTLCSLFVCSCSAHARVCAVLRQSYLSCPVVRCTVRACRIDWPCTARRVVLPVCARENGRPAKREARLPSSKLSAPASLSRGNGPTGPLERASGTTTCMTNNQILKNKLPARTARIISSFPRVTGRAHTLREWKPARTLLYWPAQRLARPPRPASGPRPPRLTEPIDTSHTGRQPIRWQAQVARRRRPLSDFFRPAAFCWCASKP